MHFEILIEDQSCRATIEAVLPRILSNDHTHRLRSYRGSGQVPKDLVPKTSAKSRILLDRLPHILNGYGRSQQEGEALVVVVDCDEISCEELLGELKSCLQRSRPAPRTLFRLAIEEAEAWLLGDRTAILAAYPRARMKALDLYVQDSQCGTWEYLADVIHPGGRKALQDKPYGVIGAAKYEWAKTIAPLMNVEANLSPSFQKFRDGMRRVARGGM
jgi:hypothetical protein